MRDGLETVDEVVAALGGPQAVADLTRVSCGSVYQWTSKLNSFPSKHYLAMTKALREKGHMAPPKLWRMTERAS